MCKNAVTEGVACLKYNHVKFVNLFVCLLLKSEMTKKKCFGKTHRISLHTYKNTDAHTKTFVCEVPENNY